MGRLTRAAGRVLGTAVLILAGTGVLVLAAAGNASARPAITPDCQKISTALGKIDTTLAALVKAHSSLGQKVAALVPPLTQAASTAPPAVKNAVAAFAADLQAGAAAGHLDVAKSTADGEAIVAACAAEQATPASGAPATGGGSTAGIVDPALFGVGGAVALAGFGVLGLGLARRNRPPGRPDHG
jgi:hypothetical protein